jgi:hypothetical protein
MKAKHALKVEFLSTDKARVPAVMLHNFYELCSLLKPTTVLLFLFSVQHDSAVKAII